MKNIATEEALVPPNPCKQFHGSGLSPRNKIGFITRWGLKQEMAMDTGSLALTVVCCDTERSRMRS